MHPELKTLLYKAENEYLQASEIKAFNNHIGSLAQRLETYETIRDREIDIFQPLADKLSAAFSKTDEAILEQVLKNWLSILRYCAMAMLMNNSEFLQQRLLEWMSEVVKSSQVRDIETSACNLLNKQLKAELSDSKFALLAPYLEQASAAISNK
jgi:hypothetical protein